MIPPCEQSVLNANPQFKSLHQQLTSDILNPDASTRTPEPQSSRKELQNDLKKRQIRSAKRTILTRAVCQLAYGSGDGLPKELRDLVLVIALYLQRWNSGFTRDDKNGDYDEDEELFSLLAPDIEAFRSSIPSLRRGISNILTSQLDHLKTLADATETRSRKSDQETRQDAPANSREHALRRQTRQQRAAEAKQSTPDESLKPLSTHLSDRLQKLRDARIAKLPAARREVADTAALVLAAQTLVMERSIDILEKSKHGSLARAERTRAEHLAKTAEELEGKVKVMAREVVSTIYTPETTAALARYNDHLQDTRLRLEEKQQNALRELAVYEGRNPEASRRASTSRRTSARTSTAETGQNREEGHAGAKNDDKPGEITGPMAALAKKYGSLAKDVEAVRLEIEKLGG